MREQDAATIVRAMILGVLLGTLLIGLLEGGAILGSALVGPLTISLSQIVHDPAAWVFAFVIWLVLLGGIAVLATWIFRQVNATVLAGSHTGRALEILAERYARGEISREEYEQARRTLEQGHWRDGD